MNPINKPNKDDRLYRAGLNSQTVELYAPSLLAAKEAAIKYFKPSKKNLGLLWVELAD